MIAGKYKLVRTLAVCLLLGGVGRGASVRDAVESGNQLFAAGDFTGAIGEYDEALVENPRADEARFNKANSYFRLDDLDKSVDLFRQVAAESKDMSLVAKAKYNLGNCFFEKGIKQRDSDLQKTLDDLKASIGHWRGVLDIDADNEKAARNIEVARLIIKDVIDQINKEKQEQEEQNQLAEKLKELLERQKAVGEKTEQTNSQAKEGKATAEQAKGEYGEQSAEQSAIRKETMDTATQMRQDPNAAQQPEMQEAIQEMSKAVDSQAKAEGQLNSADGAGGRQSEGEAAEHIEKALEALSQGDKQEQQQEQQQQEQQDQQQDQSGDPNEPQEQDQEEQEQEEAADATAQEILDKEQKEKEERQTMRRPGYQQVDKDW